MNTVYFNTYVSGGASFEGGRIISLAKKVFWPTFYQHGGQNIAAQF